PSTLLLLMEGRAFYELGVLPLALPLLRRSPPGDGHPVLVLPGFLAGDASTVPLRLFLKRQGYRAEGWRLGVNLGPKLGLRSKMLRRLKRLRKESGRRVSLIGWSLGGIYARALARWAPDDVRSVITLGSPFTNNPKANHAWRLFEALTGIDVEKADPQSAGFNGHPLPVPSTSIFSRSDGISAWRCSLQEEDEKSENLEVRDGSHLGLGHNPLVLYAIADRLAQPEGSFARFDAPGVLKVLYPDPRR
ncbi:MAG TPA: alpha/beta hydrolase, partial [Thermoanaerobaculia bacterium]|nr:alpha/beta hydrolase [Thermoanaerobaculia bacterium]